MTEENNTFDRRITVKFNRYLENGEHIVWCGKGYTKTAGAAYLAAKLYMFVFATIWMAFVLFWMHGVSKASSAMAMFAVPFIVAGIMMYVKAFKSGRTKAFFAVTNMRILTDAGRGLEMEYLENVISARTEEKGRRAVVIYEIEYQGEQGIINSRGTIGGLSPEEAENVCYIIESESAQAHMYS